MIVVLCLLYIQLEISYTDIDSERSECEYSIAAVDTPHL